MNEFPAAFDNILTTAESDFKKEMLVDSTLSLIFDWDFLTAWIACTTWAEVADALENHESGGDVTDEMKIEVSLMRSVFLLCITALYNNPYSTGIQIM